MTKKKTHEEGELAKEASGWSSAWQAVRRRPVTSLAIAAGIGALAGAELLAAGLLGGAAAIWLQRQDVTPRLRKGYADAQRRLRELAERARGSGPSATTPG